MEQKPDMILLAHDGTRFGLKLGKGLGFGAFGDVFSATFLGVGKFRFPERQGKSWNSCAVKCHRSFVPGTKEVEKIQRISQIRHDNIIKFLSYGSITSSERIQIDHYKWCIALELCDGGTLNQKVMEEKLPNKVVVDYTKQILLGLQHLHEHRIIHADLKGANIFLTNNCSLLKIGDLDAHIVLQGSHTITDDVSHKQGTWKWMSPEMVRHRSKTEPQYYFAENQLEEHRVGRRTDIWSVGCVVLEMITQVKFNLVNGGGNILPCYESLLLAAPTGFSPCVPDLEKLGFQNMTDILKSCFQTAPSNRPLASDLLRSPVFYSTEQAQAKDGVGHTGLNFTIENDTVTVEKGDTAYAIAMKHGMTLESLKKLNPGKGTLELIRPGDQLIVQKVSSLTKPVLVVPPRDTYVVKKGDTAYGIAKQHGLSMEKLAQLNPEKKNLALIRLGDVFNV